MKPSPQEQTMPPTVYRTFIQAPPADVFEALATGDGWSAWFTDDAVIEPEQGGRYRFEWASFGADRITATLEGPVVEYEAGKRFAFQWEAGPAVTTVRFTLEPRGEGTLVEVEEAGYGTTREALEACLDCACGWGEALTLLKFYLEHGVTYGPVPE